MYSVDPDPQARFWRTATATKAGNVWSASLPILSVDQPLFAFANVHYRLEKPEPVPFAQPTAVFAISSILHTVTPDELKRAEVKATDKEDPVIDDFTHGWQDWYTLSPDNPHHWEYSTRKLNDSKWQGQTGQRLVLDVQAEKPNELVIVLTENFFRSYRGKSQEFVAVVKLSGVEMQTISLTPGDFRTTEGEKLSSWKHVDLLSLRAYHDKDGKLLGSKGWTGPQPKFHELRWATGQR